MADDTETEDQPVAPVAPPAQAIVPRGTGYTYSTPGPANWQQPRTVAGPGGAPVQIPQNAQNFASVVGPPPEDQETAAFRKMFNSLPMDQAIKAYQAAKQFQGTRVLQTKLAGYLATGMKGEDAVAKALTDAAAVGLFSGAPKEVMGLQHNLAFASAAAERAKQQMDARKMAEDAAMARTKYVQEQENFRMTQRHSDTMADVDKESIRALERQQDRAQSAADRLESQATTFTAPKMQKQMRDQAKALSDRADQIQTQIDSIRGKYKTKPVETEPSTPPAPVQPKPLAQRRLERAQEISRKNPKLTKGQIVKMVNQEITQ